MEDLQTKNAQKTPDKGAGPQAYRDFLGISRGSDNVLSVLERSEYDVVFGRLKDVVASSSSEFPSGTARFFPFGSRTGSLIVRGAAGGNAARRVLQKKHVY
jgi:hypothetical protein